MSAEQPGTPASLGALAFAAPCELRQQALQGAGTLAPHSGQRAPSLGTLTDAAHDATDWLSSPVDKEREDFTVYSGKWPMGRIYEQRANPEHVRWFWSIFGILEKPSDVRTDGYATIFDAAKADFEASWRRWLARAELSEKGPLNTSRDSRRSAQN